MSEEETNYTEHIIASVVDIEPEFCPKGSGKSSFSSAWGRAPEGKWILYVTFTAASLAYVGRKCIFDAVLKWQMDVRKRKESWTY